MDIASSLPFDLRLIKDFPIHSEMKATIFFDSEEELWNQDTATLSAEEHENITILFQSSDINARLYIDALDIMPLDDKNIKEDSNGFLYRCPSESPFVLYENGAGYDELRVDVFKISIFAKGRWYFGGFEVLPKPMSPDEWIMMKEDLESEICGLAQDIVRRNIGMGNSTVGNIPPKELYDFLVIKKYSQHVLHSLVDIAENPRYEITTEYEMVSAEMTNAFDAETTKRYVTKAGSEATFKKPVKKINYNIQDNRLLKLIISEYEKKLNKFLDLLETVNKYEISFDRNNSAQYRNALGESIYEFKETAQKLRKMTSILKTKDWYFSISNINQPYIPHSFILDSRYNVLYQMYLNLKKETFRIELDPKFSYTWKRSSYLYEMWCFFKVCHLLLEKYEITTDGWKFIFSDKVLFPFLDSGTELTFEDEAISIKVVFDNPLPLNNKYTSKENPLYITRQHDSRMHNRPDIVMHIYSKSSGWYLGTLILECKYRKLYSFWSEHSVMSSRGQLEAYFNNGRSLYLYDNLGGIINARPIRSIIVLTPDILGEGRKQEDFNIVIKGIKPSTDEHMNKSLQQLLFHEISIMQESEQQLRGISNSEQN